MRHRLLWVTIFLAVSSMVFAAGTWTAAQAEELVVICFGGGFEAGWRQTVIKRFEEKYPGDKVRIATGLTLQVAAMMRAQKDNPEIDVVMMDPVGAAQCEAEGLFEPLTEDKVPNIKNLLPILKKKQEKHPWTYFLWDPEVLVYNTKQFKTPPDSWKVMFDPKYSGRISFGDISAARGVGMLITSSRIHGGDLLNMDPGFKAIEKMKPHIHSFWTMHPQIQQLLAREEVWLTCESMNMACPVMANGAPVDWVIPKEGAHVTLVTIGISKNTKHLDLAYRYINFVLDAETQALNAKVMYSSPVIKNVPVDPVLIEKHMIPKPEDLEKLTEPDWNIVNKERPKWVERWRREIAVK